MFSSDDGMTLGPALCRAAVLHGIAGPKLSSSQRETSAAR